MTNNRGNYNSFEHTNPKEFSIFKEGSKYWNFTYHDMAEFDLKANIDYILETSGHTKLGYIGHSQGTAQFFAGNSMEDYSEKVEAFVGLGPVIYVDNQESPLVKVLIHTHLASLLEGLGINNIMVFPKTLPVFLRGIVQKLNHTVWRFVQLLCGISTDPIVDIDRMAVMVRHEPGGTSLKNMRHWFNNMMSGRFGQYDYGKEGNLKHYGTETAPEYDVPKMAHNIRKMPTLLMQGKNDALVDTKDFGRLKGILEG